MATTSYSSPAVERGLDSMLLVYSLLEGHPGSSACAQFIAGRSGWFTSVLTILEAKAILTKVYGVAVSQGSQKLAQVAAAPIMVVHLDAASALAAFQLSDSLGIDLTDAVLLHTAQTYGATAIATDDLKLSQVCGQVSLAVESPIDAPLRQQIAAWELAHLPPKGLQRVLRRVHGWLSLSHAQAAQDFCHTPLAAAIYRDCAATLLQRRVAISHTSRPPIRHSRCTAASAGGLWCRCPTRWLATNAGAEWWDRRWRGSRIRRNCSPARK